MDDFIGLDISLALEEMRRERASLARLAAALMLVLVFAGAWSCAHLFSSSAQPDKSFGVYQEEPARLK